MIIKSLKLGIITDAHYDPFYDENSSPNYKCHNFGNSHQNFSFAYGQTHCNSPLSLVNSTLTNLKSLNPDIILFLGDSLAHYFPISQEKEFDQNRYDQIILTMSNFFDSIIKTFDSQLFVHTFGNNDYLYHYQVPKMDIKENYYSFFYEKLIKNVTTMNNFDTPRNRNYYLKGGYYSIIHKNLKLISLNSLYFHLRNNESNDPLEANEQLQWLEEELQNCRISNLDSILIMHIPPGTVLTLINIEKFWKKEFELKFFAIINKFQDIIKIAIAGHVHFTDINNVVTNQENNNLLNLLITRAITPIYNNNPGFQLLELDDMNNPINLEDFYLDLEATQNQKDIAFYWNKGFSSQIELEMKNLSNSSIYIFLSKLYQNPVFLFQYELFQFGLKY